MARGLLSKVLLGASIYSAILGLASDTLPRVMQLDSLKNLHSTYGPSHQIIQEKKAREQEHQRRDEDSLARMLFGEARNCVDDEMRAVAYTAVNRSHDGRKWNGQGSVTDVVYAPKQFSCFNEGDPNRVKTQHPEKYDAKNWQRTQSVARSVMAGQKGEFNKGQTHYHTKAINPSWNKNMEKIDFSNKEFKHQFWREE